MRLEDAEPDARCTAGHAAKAVPRQGQCVKSYEARCRSSSEWFPASSLVCFCITCQAFFLSARKPASAPCAAPAPCTAQPPSRTQPQTRTRPHRVRRSPALTPRAQPQACTCTGRICRKSGFPQSLHRVFHNFAGFPQWLSFPLAFFERDRVRYAYAVRSYCAVRPGLVWYGWVRYGAPLLLCDITRDRKSPPFRAYPVTDPINIHFKG